MGPDRAGFAVTVAIRLIGMLEDYVDVMADVVDVWPDDLHRERRQALMSIMRAEAASLPQIRVPWVDFLISHGNLIVKLSTDLPTEPQRFDLLETHVGKVLDIQGRCLELATGKRRLS